ncbi:hypothetical protein TNCV_127581 [Trichonephila clavipes]|nr:hypothetical protein TNCV_127581 [Trichonephila clavipes]
MEFAFVNYQSVVVFRLWPRTRGSSAAVLSPGAAEDSSSRDSMVIGNASSDDYNVQELWFQQDGATCHTARVDLLKDTFGDLLKLNWPPRSCDLTPLDYFLGLCKVMVSNKTQTLDQK